MKRLAKVFNISSDLLEGLEGVTVDKIDFYSDKRLINILLSGIDNMEDIARPDLFFGEIEKATGCRCSILFTDAKKENLSKYLRILEGFIIGTLSEKDLMYPDQCSFDATEDGERVIIKFNGVYAPFMDEPEEKNLGRSVINFIETSLNLEVSDYDFILTDVPVKDNDPGVAMGDEREVLPLPFVPDIPEELLHPPVKEEKTEVKEKVNKDSWAYKAKEQQKINKENGNDTGKRRSANADSLFGKVRSGVSVSNISDVSFSDKLVNVVGEMSLTGDMKLNKAGTVVVASFNVIDKTGGISCVMFVKPDEADDFQKKFQKGGYAGFQGEPSFNKGELGLKVNGIFEAEKPPVRHDYSEMKRVELHVHSKMSEKDAVSEPDKIMKLAAGFGHRACAITDHGVVQAFPEVYHTAMGLKVGDTDEPFKAILGCEGYLVDDGPTIFYNLPYDPEEMRHAGEFVSVAIRTTGKDSCEHLITEIAATKYRLKGYKAVRPQPEGESDEDAGAFSSKDIDRSLYSVDEIPEELRDENITITPFVVERTESHIINENAEAGDLYSEDDQEKIPEELVFERVADFYAEVEDEIYKGKGEPCGSYFTAGELLEFIGGSYITGPNVFETLNFIRRAGYGIDIEEHKYYRYKFLMPAISCEDIIRYVYEGQRPETTFEKSGNDLIDEARDAASLVASYITSSGTTDPYELNAAIGHLPTEEIKLKKTKTYHIIFLVRNNLGLYNLYRLISEAHTHYFSFRPRTPKSLLKYYASSIIVGGACERGEIYREVMSIYKECGKNVALTKKELLTRQSVKDILSLYEYVEIQPLCNNMFMTRQDPAKSDTGNVPLDADDIRIVNELLVFLADSMGMLCVATTDSHFLEKEDGMYRKTILEFLGFSDADMQSDLYFRTTQEMLDEFSYLGEDKAFEVVVKNTNIIADKIEYGIKPFPDGTYPPIVTRSPIDVRDIAFTKANQLYRYKGKLNETVAARLEKELKSIIGNGFSVMYYIAYRLVKKSNNDGYIVGSRGSVGSSFVATMCGISEVNPLPPHYRCPNCCYTEFNNTGEFGSGFDMPEKKCPECGADMIRDGQDIPFETFLGFFGDKQPDIDLNFSDEYQPRAHKYVEFLFGKSFTFRAGTIGAFQEKNAYGIIRKVAEQKGVEYSSGMMAYMAKEIIGVKSTTGQHPGGIVVVPKEMDIYEFTPVQYPANDYKKGIITTHFDFRAMHDTILKLDILGHADPTVLRMLHEITGIDIQSIPIPDDKVMSLFAGTEALGFPTEKSEAQSATIGLPELGTSFARGMIKEAKPSHFFDLVQLMGLSHGTDVWLGNAQDLIRDGICDIGSVIGCRDSIMTRLIYWGLPNKDSFDIMEKVRKGKGLSEAHEKLMRDNNVPDWYIDSCKKIKYMFPKAHAAAYSISSLRVAWFKVYYPEAYYCAYFTIRGDEFKADYLCQGVDKVIERRREVTELGRTETNQSRQKKLKDELYICEIVEEMYNRGIEFVPIDINTSDAVRFKIVEKGKILPPLDTIDSISSGIATSITDARKDGPFGNREDLMVRSGIGKAAVKTLADYGLLDDLPESSQMDIFSLLGN